LRSSRKPQGAQKKRDVDRVKAGGLVSPHISPGFVARPARRLAQWGFRPEGRGART
jgi:hypothetical protein